MKVLTLQFRKRDIIIFLILSILLSILAYWNTFSGEFQFDDDASIVENPYVTDISKFSKLPLTSALASGLRPVATFTFSVNHYFWGLDVRPYHITNFLIHAFNALLVFYLAYLTIRSPKLKSAEQDRALFVASITSAIFLLHPIQTEAVSYISQRYESLASLFYLCSLIAYIKARQSMVRDSRFRVYMLYALSVISGLLALGSKEIAITLPVVIILYDFYFLKDKPFLARIAGPGMFILLASVAGIVILKSLKGIDAGFSVQGFTPWEYLLTQFRVIAEYIRLAFLPIGQNLDYDFRASKSLFEIGTFLSFLFLLCLFAAAIMLFKRWRIGSFFILWFFIILAPTSSIVPIIDPIFEHRVYLSSMGIFIVISDALWVGLSRIARGGLIYWTGVSLLAILILMVLLSALTFQRNKVWQTKLSLWQDAVRKSPLKSRPHNNLGNSYMLLDMPFEAIEEYKKAIALDKTNIEAYYNLAINLDNVGLLEQAVYYYDVFLRAAPAQYEKQKELARERVKRFYKKDAVFFFGSSWIRVGRF